MAVQQTDLVDTGTTGVVSEPTRVRQGWAPLRSKKILAGLVIFAVFGILAVIGPWIAPYDPSALSSAALQAPSATHWLGTTQTGQDVFSQILVGSRSAMVVGFVAGAVATALAVLIGVASGFVGGGWDEVLSALTNVFLVLPSLPLVIVLAAYAPGKGNVVVALVISVTGWAWGARVLRAQTLSIRRRDYVEAARATGERTWWIILFEVIPNELAIIASTFLGAVLGAILAAAGLAFLGLAGVSDWSWGTVLYWAQNSNAFQSGAWWWFVPAGLCIALVGMSMALINFGLDEFINPRLRAAGISSKRSRRRHAVRGRTGFTPVVKAESDAGPNTSTLATAQE